MATCEYVWKTTSKKGSKCGRKVTIEGSKFCWQHKKDKLSKSPEKIKKVDFIQLENTLSTKKKPNKKLIITTSSSEESDSDNSESI